MDALRQSTKGSSTSVELATVADFAVGDLRLSPSRCKLFSGNSEATVQPRVMQVLVVLALSPGEVISRETLLQRCWGGLYVGDDSLNRVIAALRKVAADLGGSFKVETVPRVGYRLLEQVERRGDAPSQPLLRSPWMMVPLFLIILGAGFLWSRQTAAPAPPTVALAHFTVFSSDAQAKAYADKITSTTADVLANSGVRIVSIDADTSASGARSVGADLMITGEVRQDEGRVEVDTRLLSARTGATLAAREFSDGAGRGQWIPDHIVAQLAMMVENWLTFRAVEPDPTLTEQFLHIGVIAGADTLQAQHAWRSALQLAEAKPHSALAQAVFVSTAAYWLPAMELEDRRSTIPAARSSAAIAARLRPEFQFFFPCMLTPPGRQIMTAACDSSLRRSYAANPTAPFLPAYFSEQLASAGRFHEAQALAENAVAQSPFHPTWLSDLMLVLAMEEPSDAANQLPELRAKFQRYWQGMAVAVDYKIAVAQGNADTAESILKDPVFGPQIVDYDGRQVALAVLRAQRTRRVADVRAARSSCLGAIGSFAPPDPVFATCLAGLTLAGDKDAAFELAYRGYYDVEGYPSEQEGVWLRSGGAYPSQTVLFGKALAEARKDSRFVDLARRTGLLAYWRSGHPPDFCAFEQVPVCGLLKSHR